MNKLRTAIALTIAIPTIAHAQATPAPKAACCEKMKAEGKECCCKDMAAKDHKGNDGHDMKQMDHEPADGERGHQH
jgi:hypothetical protein